MIFSKFKSGFTLAEMIVVISVIAILAAVSYVSYTNWRSQTMTAQIKSDLNSAATAMEDYRNFNNAYPSSIPSTFTSSSGTSLSVVRSSATSYCINGTSSSNASIQYYIDQNKIIKSGQCT